MPFAPFRSLRPGAAGRLGALVFALATPISCGRGERPVARLALSNATLRLAYPETAAVRFEWTVSAPLEKRHGRPTVFVHLLDRPGSVRRTFDHPFPQNWSPGRTVGYDLDLYQSALGKPLPPRRYLLTAGLYDSEWGYRWALDAGSDVGKREYQVATVDVPPRAEGEPVFEFSGGWGPSESDGSVQILARRRLIGPAALRVSAPKAPGQIRLALSIANPPVSIGADCGPGAGIRPPQGWGWVGFEVSAGGRCEILFETGPAAAGTPASSLDVAAWRPASR